jgi:hypothetical protein
MIRFSLGTFIASNVVEVNSTGETLLDAIDCTLRRIDNSSDIVEEHRSRSTTVTVMVGLVAADV